MLIHDFISLIFPRICAGCGNSLWKNEEVICHFCEYRLPKTGFHKEQDNPVFNLFTGRVIIEGAAAFLFFNKGNNVQRLVHQLKYKGRKDIGVFLGECYGLALKHSSPYRDAEVIVPVPLHKKRYMKRGYNQSEQFALGLSAIMKIPVDRHLLARTVATETQTRKSRFSRYQNVRDIFSVSSPETWCGKHLLLVDDVITTGATLESGIIALHTIPDVRISVVSIAASVR